MLKRKRLLKVTTLMLPMFFFSLWCFGQASTIRGTVKDEKGTTLPGVSVIVKETNTVTVTDGNGNYSISAPAGAKTLKFSFVGMAPQEISIEGKTQIDVALIEDIIDLNEIVVVGYGTVKKSDLTGAVASINQKTLKEVPVTNVAQSMQGRVAGVEIQQTSTRPGDATQIRIRGVRSLSATNDPLIIVDGIPFMGTLNDISPNDIKSVDILKDASATAIYGSRGSNGVILITTNRGEANNTVVKYSGYTGFGNVVKEYEVFNADEFIKYKSQPGATTFPLITQEIAGQAAGVNTDWQKLMYKTAKIQNHDISISGGNETITGSTGFGYYDETAVLPGQAYKRLSGRITLDIMAKEWLKIGINSQNAFAVRNGENANNMFNMLANSPLVAPYDENGNIVKQPHYPREDSYSPLLDKNLDLWTQERKRYSTLNSAFLEIKFLPELKYRANVGLNYSHDDYGDFYSSESSFKTGGLSSASTSYTTQYNYAFENLLFYDKTFNDVHHLGVTLMQSTEDQFYTYASVTGSNMTADYQQFYNLGMAKDGVAVDANKQKMWEKVLLSYMGRINYSYDNRYYATATFRSDGSSVLSDGKKWHSYPALALAWNVSNESFMKDIPALNMLKVRLGYGETSNQSVDPYKTLGTMAQNKYNFGNSYQYGYYVNSLSTVNVGWEYTKTYNAGIDWGLFRNRINGSFEVYIQKTNDVLVNQSLLPSSGVSGNILANIGKTQNKGLEITLHSENFVAQKNGDFSWETDFNFGLNRNKIVSLASNQTQDIGNGWFVGKPINVIYDYNKVGIWQTAEKDSAKKYGASPGDIKVEDLNHDGKIDADHDRKIVGNFDPDFTFGITNRFAYKNFDLGVVTYGQVGGTLVSTIHQPQAYINRLEGRRNNLKVDYWTEDNPTNAYPRVNSGMNANLYYTLGYFSSTYWKIKTITLGYTIPENIIKRLNISSLRIYATCNNVATLFSPYIKAGGLDPQPTQYYASENGGGNQQTRQLIVGMNTPPTRQFLFGIDVKF